MPTLVALPQSQQDRRAADLPILTGRSVLELATTIQWRSGGSLASGSDVTLTGYPGRRAGDGRSAEHTRPTSAGTTHYLCADLGAARTWDVAALLGHAIGPSGAPSAVLAVADDAAFTSGLTTIATWSLTDISPVRRVSTQLAGAGGPGAVVTARYVRLTITYSSSQTPAVGELHLGSRLALPCRLLYPTESEHRPQLDERARWSSDGGLEDVGPLLRGRLGGDLRWLVESSEESALLAWGRDCGWGRYTGLYVPRPNSEPNTGALVTWEAPTVADTAWGGRELSMGVREHLPTLRGEGL